MNAYAEYGNQCYACHVCYGPGETGWHGFRRGAGVEGRGICDKCDVDFKIWFAKQPGEYVGDVDLNDWIRGKWRTLVRERMADIESRFRAAQAEIRELKAALQAGI